MRVLVTRRGGIAGVSLHADLATSDLDAATAARVEEALDRLMDQPHAASAAQPDRFYYKITLPEHNRSTFVAEHDVPADLTPLLDMLSNIGSVGKGGSTGPPDP